MKKTRAFHWRAGRRSGELHGPSIAWARATLRRRGVPNAVVRAAKHRGGGRKPAAAEVQLFSQQLAAMLGAGVPLASSLATLARHSPRPALQVMLGAVHNEVRAGVALSAALEKYPATFSPLYLSLVRAGELAGALAQTLDNLAVYLRKSIALRKKIKSALAYPAVVVTVAVTVVALMMVFVIPQFEAMFGHYETELPPLTRAVVNASAAARDGGPWFLPAVVCIAAALGVARRRFALARLMLDRLALAVPLAGALLRKAALARIARTLATLLGAGMPLLECIAPAAEVAGNTVFRNAVLSVRDGLSGGHGLETSMRAARVFPPLFLQMVRTGEESGQLVALLHRAGDFLEAEVDSGVAALSKLLEPLVMALLGGVVGLIVVAMYLPVFNAAAVF